MPEPTLTDIEARLRRLEDIDAIKRLRMWYHVHINADAFERMGELFTEDAEVDFGSIGKAHGIAEIRHLYMGIPEHTAFVRQYIHNHMIDVDGDRATGLSFLDARYAHNGQALVVGGTFNETYRRCPDGWRIDWMKVDVWFAVPIDKGWGDLVRGAPADSSGIEPFR